MATQVSTDGFQGISLVDIAINGSDNNTHLDESTVSFIAGATRLETLELYGYYSWAGLENLGRLPLTELRLSQGVRMLQSILDPLIRLHQPTDIMNGLPRVDGLCMGELRVLTIRSGHGADASWLGEGDLGALVTSSLNALPNLSFIQSPLESGDLWG